MNPQFQRSRRRNPPANGPAPADRGLELALIATAAFMLSLGAVWRTGRPTPAETVQRYCQLDFSGARLSSDSPNSKAIAALATWQVEPGWDTAVNVKSFEIVNHGGSAESESVDVRYDKIGQLQGESGLEINKATETITFHLISGTDGWQITKPQIPPHISAQAAISNLRALLRQEHGTAARAKLHQAIAQLQNLASIGGKLSGHNADDPQTSGRGQ